MATLTIRNLPDDVHAALKERARMNRRSVNQEVIAELATVGLARDEAPEKALNRIQEMRSRMKGFMTSEEIDEAKKEGRR